MALTYYLVKLPSLPIERFFMKKVLISSLLALALIGASDVSHAATTKPTVKKPTVSAGGGEGTAAHEQGESASTQGEEGAAPAKKMPAKKKVVVKKTTAKK
jgi:hypothetical protein